MVISMDGNKMEYDDSKKISYHMWNTLFQTPTLTKQMEIQTIFFTFYSKSQEKLVSLFGRFIIESRMDGRCTRIGSKRSSSHEPMNQLILIPLTRHPTLLAECLDVCNIHGSIVDFLGRVLSLVIIVLHFVLLDQASHR